MIKFLKIIILIIVLGVVVYFVIKVRKDSRDNKTNAQDLSVSIQDPKTSQPDIVYGTKLPNLETGKIVNSKTTEIPVDPKPITAKPNKVVSTPTIIPLAPSNIPLSSSQVTQKIFNGANGVNYTFNSSWGYQSNNNGHLITFYELVTTKIVGGIEWYSTNDSIDDICQQISSSAGAMDIAQENYNQQEFIKYSVNGLPYVAFIKNGGVYYVSGELASNNELAKIIK